MSTTAKQPLSKLTLRSVQSQFIANTVVKAEEIVTRPSVLKLESLDDFLRLKHGKLLFTNFEELISQYVACGYETCSYMLHTIVGTEEKAYQPIQGWWYEIIVNDRAEHAESLQIGSLSRTDTTLGDFYAWRHSDNDGTAQPNPLAVLVARRMDQVIREVAHQLIDWWRQYSDIPVELIDVYRPRQLEPPLEPVWEVGLKFDWSFEGEQNALKRLKTDASY